MIVIGIDLSSSEIKGSAYAVLNLNYILQDIGHFYHNREILDIISRIKPALVSIDAPLSFSNKGFRKCEKLMLKRGYKIYPTTIKWMRQLALRGIKLARDIQRMGIQVIETHPTSSLRACGFIGNSKSKQEVVSFIVDIWNISVPDNASKDMIDAIIASIAGVSYLRKKAIIFSADDGEIILASP